MNVNVTGVWNGSQVFGRRMAAAGKGVIVNVGSISGQIVNRPSGSRRTTRPRRQCTS